MKANAFSGQYVITSYQENQLVQYKPNAAYGGNLPKPANGEVDVKYYTDAANLQLDVASGGVDAAFRSLAPTDIATDRSNTSLNGDRRPPAVRSATSCSTSRRSPSAPASPTPTRRRRSPCVRRWPTSSTAPS